MPIFSVAISSTKYRSSYLPISVLVGIVSAIAIALFATSASVSAAEGWPGWSAVDTIVVLAPQDDNIDGASADLESHLETISGGEWNVSYTDVAGPAIRLSIDPANPIFGSVPQFTFEEAVYLRTDPNGLEIIGTTSRAVRNGASTLLEHLGVRWLHPQELWTIYPAFLSEISYDEVVIPGLADRRLSNQIGFVAGYEGGVDRWYDYVGRNRLRRGKSLPISHSWTFFAPIDEVEAQDPTAVCNGADGLPIQVVPDHPVVVQRALDYARDWFDDDPTGERRAVSISPPDGRNIWCESWKVPETGDYDLDIVTTQVYGLVNEVARMLQVEYPGKYVTVQSYSLYSDVPTIALEDNIYVAISTFGRGVQTLDERIAGFAPLSVVTGLYAYFDVWNYDHDDLPPYGFEERVFNILDKAATTGQQGFVAESSDQWISKGRLYWIAAQKIVDPTRDTAGLQDEYYDLAFGPAQEVIRRIDTRIDTQTHDERVWGLNFIDLELAWSIANSSGDPILQERIKQVVLHYYFLWKYNDAILSGYATFADVTEATKIFTYLESVKKLQVVTYYPASVRVKGALENDYGLSQETITAMEDGPEPTFTEAGSYLDEANLAFEGITLVDAFPVVPTDSAYVALGDNVAPSIDGNNGTGGFWRPEVIVTATGPETIQFDVFMTQAWDETLQLLDWNGNVVDQVDVKGWDCKPCTVELDAVAAGNHRITASWLWTYIDIDRAAGLDLSKSGTFGDMLLGGPLDGYIYVDSEATGLVINIDTPLSTAVATEPDGTVHSMATGSLAINAPSPGLWRLQLPAEVDGTQRTIQILGIAPLMWHDPAQLLVPATAVTFITADDSYYVVPDGQRIAAEVEGVLANDTDFQGDPLTASLDSGPANGILALDPTGAFTYTPDPGFVGSDSFTYTASDSAVSSPVTTVTISVGSAINGNVGLQSVATGSTAFSNIGVTVTLSPDGGGDELTAQVGADGAFSMLGVIAGSYTITASTGGFQSAERVDLVIVESDIVMPVVELKIGLVNGDSWIDGPDLSLVVGNFGYFTTDRTDSFDNWVDLNGDGAVSALDISSTVSNIGLWGEQAW